MTPFGIFRKKKKEEKEPQKKAPTPQPTQKTLLEQLCGGDKKLYEVLSRTVLLNPETIVDEGINSYTEKAQEYEKDGDHAKARIAYQAAGEISLYQGKLAQVQKLFKKAAEVDPDYPNKKLFEYFSKKENAERALEVAQEFYTKTGKRAGKDKGSGN